MSTLTKSWRRRDAETTSRGGAATRRVRGGRSRRDGDAWPGETRPEPRLCEYPWTSRGAAAAATWIFRRQLREATRRHRQSETGRDPGASAQATTTAIGGCYFAPAAHVWYDKITQLIPKNGVKEILSKAALGQLLFGPLVTIVFFAAACLQSDEGLGALPGKIKNDLVAVQLAGVSFWPIVDIVSFSLIPVAYIPLFVNFASFIWTIFLSLKSRTAKK